jgi:outer membrane protein assembly factor BamB
MCIRIPKSFACAAVLRPIVIALLFMAHAAAGEWPQWRGPNRDGVSSEKGWLTQWPAAGPRMLWKTTVGNGCSSVAVVGGRLYTMGFALTRGPDGKTIKGDAEGRRVGTDTVWCIDANTAAPIWKHSYASLGDDTYCTPTVYQGLVYTLGRFGQLYCFEADSGHVVWSKDLVKDFAGIAPYYGYACSPLVIGDRLIVGCGGEKSQILCLDRKTGEPLWKCGKGPAGFSSAVTYETGGKPAVLMMTPPNVLAISADDGQELWRFPWKGHKQGQGPSAATTPIILGDRVFLSGSGSDHLAVVLQMPMAPGSSPKVIWQNEEMANYFQSSVLVNGYVYGTHTVNHEAKTTSLRCLSFDTGEVKWIREGFGHAPLMAADGKLIIMGDRGELVVAEASPAGFKELARAQVLGGQCWACPVLCDGRIYCRSNGGNLICLDVRP